MANLFEPDFNEQSEQPGFSWRRALLGRQVGSEHLGASLFALPPGEALFPLHYHLGNEEMLVVIEGAPSLRTLDSERTLERGEVVAFPRGELGAHQVVNRSDSEARVLLISEMNAPEVVIRPESGKLSAFGRPPGGRGEGIHRVFHERDEAPLWEGEDPPPPATAPEGQ
ncbi:MAG: cupin domain-containing protein [Solirubrobacterales bacterium]